MKEYEQLSYEERVHIAELRQLKFSLRQIATAVRRSKSTIGRELKRNGTVKGCYWPEGAQGQMLKRRRRGCLLDRDKALKDFIMNQLQCHGWPPRTDCGLLKI